MRFIGNELRRFWSKTRKQGSCIVWTAGLSERGYGQFMIGPRGQQRCIRAHRWIYERVFGPLGRTLLLHSCDTPGCVALQHLSPGTQKQNVAEAIARGHRGPGELAGNHKLTRRQADFIRRSKTASRKLAKRFGVSLACVQDIRSGRRWK